MAVHELRKFKFFDLVSNIDKGALSSALKGTHLSVSTSGHNCYIFGDGEGNVIILNKSFEVTIFKAYNFQITHAEYIKHSPFLVTIGDDEPGINPALKVWNTDVTEKGGCPKCIRINRLIPNQKAVVVTALGLHESATYLAVGFENGSILLFHGDISRAKNKKPRLILIGNNIPVTGLAFRVSATAATMFVTNELIVHSYDISSKDREIKCVLDDEHGSKAGCCTMADIPHGAHFVVAKSDGLYCFTSDGKGPCYAMEGEKTLVQWSKSFLAIVSKEDRTSDLSAFRSNALASEGPSTSYTLSVLDVFNSLIVFTSPITEVKAILVECGSFYIVTSDQNIHHLAEKDVQSKLALLFKKNLYDAAIRMAKSQHYDEDGLVDIYRQYGDHLNSKGDRAGAIEQYIKTIGRLEPSYIIRKFMDAAHMEQLMEYLQVLHRKGLANGDHTTLLLNCYIKLGRATDLKDFIMTKGRKVEFDIETALKVVRGVSKEDALSLAKEHGRHLWYVRILLEDLKKYQEAISYISSLGFHEAEKCILDFGGILIDNAPDATTDLLKDFCTRDFSEAKPKEANLFEPFGNDNEHVAPRPQDFLHLFLLKSDYLVSFLEHLVAFKRDWDRQIYNALVEHYLVLWSREKTGNRMNIEKRLLKLLENPDAPYDREHAFILCQMYDFAPGRVLLYEENKMYYLVVQTHVKEKNYTSVLAACRRFGQQDPNIWIQALWSVAQQPDTPQHVLSEILTHIEKEKLQAPVMTIEALGDGATLGQARKYLAAVLQNEDKLVAEENALIEKFSKDTSKVRSHIKDIETQIIFQESRCGVCERKLELPSVHFLCQHSYHQHCLQRYSDSDNECFLCRKNNKVLKEMISRQETSHELNETFHRELKQADDGFTLVANYFGHGVFNKVTLAPPETPPPVIVPTAATIPPRFPTETVNSRPLEPITPAISIKKSNLAPESDLIAYSLTKSASPAQPERSFPRPQESQPLISVAANPFSDDEGEDDSKNPFADEAEDARNPFSSGDSGEYDDSLNPFA